MRPLCDDESDSPQAITRDYTLDIHDEDGKAPLLSVFGGKLTTYRKLAEHALEKLTPYYQGIGPAWTKESVLPGGAIEGDRDDYAARLRRRYPFLDRIAGTSLRAHLRQQQRTVARQCRGDKRPR
ncbi:aerobic glycerol-3-phosphate dehydrogenase [Escherichia coli]|uniref:Aerobic glycerol-3-phosphate dehydrogenase n=1 Tax=Escherichia coli TaxID=562 RepID=A0A484Y533_ECOLX|nr:aerobic glycerol-3-phosphate dehydrogenase [Escherichia coli]